MIRRFMRVWMFALALLGSLTVSARLSAKPPDLPVDPNNEVAPVFAPPTPPMWFGSVTSVPGPSQCAPVVRVPAAETVTIYHPVRPRLPLSVQERLAECVLLGAHPLLSLVPVSEWVKEEHIVEVVSWEVEGPPFSGWMERKTILVHPGMHPNTPPAAQRTFKKCLLFWSHPLLSLVPASEWVEEEHTQAVAPLVPPMQQPADGCQRIGMDFNFNPPIRVGLPLTPPAATKRLFGDHGANVDADLSPMVVKSEIRFHPLRNASNVATGGNKKWERPCLQFLNVDIRGIGDTFDIVAIAPNGARYHFLFKTMDNGDCLMSRQPMPWSTGGGLAKNLEQPADSVCPWKSAGVCDQHIPAPMAAQMSRTVLQNLERLVEAQKLYQQASKLADCGKYKESLDCLTKVCGLCPGSRFEDMSVDLAGKIIYSFFLGGSEEPGKAEEAEDEPETQCLPEWSEEPQDGAGCCEECAKKGCCCPKESMRQKLLAEAGVAKPYLEVVEEESEACEIPKAVNKPFCVRSAKTGNVLCFDDLLLFVPGETWTEFDAKTNHLRVLWRVRVGGTVYCVRYNGGDLSFGMTVTPPCDRCENCEDK